MTVPCERTSGWVVGWVGASWVSAPTPLLLRQARCVASSPKVGAHPFCFNPPPSLPPPPHPHVSEGAPIPPYIVPTAKGIVGNATGNLVLLLALHGEKQATSLLGSLLYGDTPRDICGAAPTVSIVGRQACIVQWNGAIGIDDQLLPFPDTTRGNRGEWSPPVRFCRLQQSSKNSLEAQHQVRAARESHVFCGCGRLLSTLGAFVCPISLKQPLGRGHKVISMPCAREQLGCRCFSVL